MEDLIMKRIEKASTATAKCPDCGGKYVKATKYCPSCKKKVKEENTGTYRVQIGDSLKATLLTLDVVDKINHFSLYTMDVFLERIINNDIRKHETIYTTIRNRKELDAFRNYLSFYGDQILFGDRYLENKKDIDKNIIELPEDVTIDMGDREVILEKGDKIKVMGKVE